MGKQKLRWILAVFMLMGSSPLAAEGIHMRAREHYEILQIKGFNGGESGRYASLSNTIDLWYEKPFQWAIGLAGSPLLATFPIAGSNPPAGTGDRIRLVHLGVEAKYFPKSEILPIFTRLGVYRATFQSNGSLGVLTGQSYLLGLGYEWNINGIGLAPEMAWRVGNLAQGLNFSGIAPAIGLHFYKAI